MRIGINTNELAQSIRHMRGVACAFLDGFDKLVPIRFIRRDPFYALSEVQIATVDRGRGRLNFHGGSE